MSCHDVLVREGLGESNDILASHHRHLVPRPRSASEARAFVRDLDVPLGPDAAAVLLLLVTELVTNAVLHARTTVDLGVCVAESFVLVSVTDRNEARPEQRPYPELYRSGGRGLLLVEELSARWGILPVDGGKCVWFTLKRARQPAARDYVARRPS
jgi:two-component sensor histidine kinase